MFGIIGIAVKTLYAFDVGKFVDCCLGFAIPIFSLFFLYYFHMFGAGDIKLLAVAGGFLGAAGSVFCITASFGIGAVFAIIKMLYFQSFHERFAYFFHYMKVCLKDKKRKAYYHQGQPKSCRLHFSVPIACSVLIYYVAGGI